MQLAIGKIIFTKNKEKCIEALKFIENRQKRDVPAKYAHSIFLL
jgi:hypothetical protein